MNLWKNIMNEKNPIIILISKQFNQGLAIAQCCHAIAEYIKKYGDCSNGFVYILGVDNQEVINFYKNKLDYIKIDYHHFFEPDLNKHTALCCIAKLKMFHKLKKY